MPAKKASNKLSPSEKLFAVVKIDGRIVRPPEFHLRGTLGFYLWTTKAKTIELVLDPTSKNPRYGLWASTLLMMKRSQVRKVRPDQLTAEQKRLMAIVANGPAATPSDPATAPKRASGRDRIKIWI